MLTLHKRLIQAAHQWMPKKFFKEKTVSEKNKGTLPWKTLIPPHSRDTMIFMHSFCDEGRIQTLWLYRSEASAKDSELQGQYYMHSRYKITIKACLGYRMLDESARLNEAWKIEDHSPTAIISPSPWLQQLELDEPIFPGTLFPGTCTHYIVATCNEVFDFLAQEEPIVEVFPELPPWVPIYKHKWNDSDPQT